MYIYMKGHEMKPMSKGSMIYALIIASIAALLNLVGMAATNHASSSEIIGDAAYSLAVFATMVIVVLGLNSIHFYLFKAA